MAFPRSGTVDTQTFSGTKDLVFAHSSVVQNANLAANDHLKLDTVDFSRGGQASVAGAAGGGAISLDTTTAYSNANGAASVGRFTLRGGKLYKLECSLGAILGTGATTLVTLQWFDVTAAPVALGQSMNVSNLALATFENQSGDLWTMYAPGGGQNDLFLVEVRIVAATAMTSIGDAVKGLPSVLVETY